MFDLAFGQAGTRLSNLLQGIKDRIFLESWRGIENIGCVSSTTAGLLKLEISSKALALGFSFADGTARPFSQESSRMPITFDGDRLLIEMPSRQLRTLAAIFEIRASA